ncbi:MAG: gamma-glutamyltransferase [Fidelibacterota bacterium]
MKNVIAAGDRTTVDAARVILERGGNAYDAAVGACFAAMVAEPALTSAGGGGHFMAYPSGGFPILFDFFVDMPSGRLRKSELDFFSVDVDFGGAIQTFHAGRGAAAVPGTVAGLLHVHERLGTIPLPEVMEPAIVAARDGVALSDMQIYLLNILAPIMTHDEMGRTLFTCDGTALEEGNRLVLAEFADFLDVLSREGPDLVYRGDVAKIIVEWAENGGLILARDLENYRVRERTPLATPFNGYTVLLNPPPAVSGILIDVTLSLLEATGSTRHCPLPLKTLVSAFEETNRVRREQLPNGVVEEDRQLLSGQRLFMASLERFTRSTATGFAGSESLPPGATTHISVLDRQGNAASVTTTNGEGCGYVLSQAGFMLNNMLGEEDLNPEGFHQYPPGLRLSSMLAPTIVLSDESRAVTRRMAGSPPGAGVPHLLTGTAGSNRIRSVVVQIVVNFLCNGVSLRESTDAPRVHLEGEILQVEPGIPEEDLLELEHRYVVKRWAEQNLFFGGANSATRDEGAGDSRRGGRSLVF